MKLKEFGIISNFVILKLKGIESINDGEKLKNSIVKFERLGITFKRK